MNVLGTVGTLKTNRISCPRLRLIVKGWFSSVCPLDNGWLSSLSRLRCGLSLAASDIARRHRGWRNPGSQVSLYIAVSTHICRCVIADDSIIPALIPGEEDHHPGHQIITRHHGACCGGLMIMAELLNVRWSVA